MHYNKISKKFGKKKINLMINNFNEFNNFEKIEKRLLLRYIDKLVKKFGNDIKREFPNNRLRFQDKS